MRDVPVKADTRSFFNSVRRMAARADAAGPCVSTRKRGNSNSRPTPRRARAPQTDVLIHRGDLVSDRRARHVCLRCGVTPIIPPHINCPPCLQKIYDAVKRSRQRQLDEHRVLVAQREARRLRACREVTVQVGWKKNRPIMQTFIVTNSYSTESSTARVQSSPNQFLR